jgi:hypothetical protein
MMRLSHIVHSRLQVFNNVRNLIFDICRHASDLDASKFAVLMWYIWQQRNNKVLNDNNVSVNQLGLQAASYWNQWAVINGLLQDQQQTVNHCVTATYTEQWQQPPSGFLKCNVDASFFHSKGATGWGWCLRDSRGYFKLAGTNVVNSSLNVLEGEALAIIEAMEEVIQRGIPFVIFESDSKLVVNAIYIL